MTAPTRFAHALILIVFAAAPLRAQDHPRPAGTERLGTVHFTTSCAPQVATEFDRGMAWLHSFEFAAAVRSFESVIARDSTCAIAWWGIALSRWTNPMVPNRRARLIASGEAYWAEQVAIQELAARGWLDHAAGRNTEALAQLREAAAREEATEKAAVTPGPLLPARELLADLLLDMGRAADAAVEYRRALAREPGRRRSNDGLARTQASP